VRESRGRWSGSRLGSFSRPSCKKREKKNKKRTRFGKFGQNSIEFEKCKVLDQKVVMIGSEMFLSG
jgi:hypothetical protein